MNFEGRVAVVTGGASGIGLGIVRALAKRGMKLVIADLSEPALQRAVEEVVEQGGEAVGQICDVSDLTAVQDLAETTLSTFGKVNVLCNNAGVGLPTPAGKMNLEMWRWIIEVNLWGPINGISTFLPHIEQEGEGHISTTASLAGLIAPEFMGAYAASKHGCVGLMASLERELRARHSPIRTSVLCPAAVNTNISKNSIEHRPARKDAPPRTQKDRDKDKSMHASLTHGLDPDLVGQALEKAIELEQFWVMTHPELFGEMDRQLLSLKTDRTLSAPDLGLG